MSGKKPRLYAAGATRQQVMKKHRPQKPATKPMPRRDPKREEAALSEWRYLNRD